jgi:hypothetical protein
MEKIEYLLEEKQNRRNYEGNFEFENNLSARWSLSRAYLTLCSQYYI